MAGLLGRIAQRVRNHLAHFGAVGGRAKKTLGKRSHDPNKGVKTLAIATPRERLAASRGEKLPKSKLSQKERAKRDYGAARKRERTEEAGGNEESIR